MSKKKHSSHDAPAPESFALPRTGVESHAHLNGPKFADDLEEVLARAKNTGLAYIIQVFLSADAYNLGITRFADHPEVYFILGLHPTDLNKFESIDSELERIKAIIKNDQATAKIAGATQNSASSKNSVATCGRIKAIGEIGLDYYWKDVAPELQKNVFRKQLALARELSLPVVIHCRDAVQDTLQILDEEGFSGYPLLWHCFGGDTAMAKSLLERGWHISIPGPVTFKANQPLRDAVAEIPPDRMMMETDCPYLAPMPHRGKRNEPAFLAFTIQAMAQAKNISPAELWTSCGRTAINFFGLPALSTD